MKTNYSIETSLPAYHSFPSQKKKQAEKVLNAVKYLGENACIKLVAAHVGIPDATASARINDLIKDGTLYYTDEKKVIDGMKRKIIAIVNKQLKLF